MEWESINMIRGITQETSVFRIRTMSPFIFSKDFRRWPKDIRPAVALLILTILLSILLDRLLI